VKAVGGKKDREDLFQMRKVFLLKMSMPPRKMKMKGKE
jgi:hypothetical protein